MGDICVESESENGYPFLSKKATFYRRGYPKDILSVVSQEVQEIFSDVVDDASVSLETLEASVGEACRELGRKVLEACFCQRAVCESDSVSVACQACGGEARRLRRRECYIETLCGVVRVSRWVYRCACGVSVVPWDSTEGLKDGVYTVGVAQTMCRLAVRLDFREETASELKHHGIRVSHTTLQDKVQRWASGASVSTYVAPQSLAPGSRGYVSCDGCHTASETDGWQEVKVGCLYRDDPDPDPGAIASTASSSLRYVASRGDAVSFGSQWFDLVHSKRYLSRRNRYRGSRRPRRWRRLDMELVAGILPGGH